MTVGMWRQRHEVARIKAWNQEETRTVRGNTGILGIVLCLLSGCAPESAKTQEVADDDFWASFSIAKKGDPILLPVTIGGEVKPFLLASECEVHLFDVSLQRLLGPTTGLAVARSGGMADAQLEKVSTPPLFVGQFPVPPCPDRPGLVFDFGRIRQGLEQDVQGALAASFFGEKLVQIDFDQGVLHLAPRNAPVADLGTSLPLRLDETGVPWIDGVEVGGRQESFMVSTGSNGTMEFHKWLFESLVADGHLRIEEGEARGESIAGPRTARRGWVSTLSYGGYNHRDLLVDEGDVNKLGLGYLSRYVVTVDATGGHIYLRPGKQFDRPDSVNRTGLGAGKISGVVKVTSVKDGSPADLAGLLCGDTIVAVNGTSCQHMRLMELNQRLCDSAGQKLTLTVDRQGKQIEVALAVPDAPSRHGNR